MSWFKWKKEKKPDYILNVGRLFDDTSIVLVRMDMFPNLSAVIEVHRNNGEVLELNAYDLKRVQ